MAYIQVPKESKTKINQAGKILARGAIFSDEYETALFLAIRWRTCIAYPINTFQASLRTKLKGCTGEPLVEQRLKRMPTIVDKLSRFPHMQLTTMQDIAGLRAILDNVKDAQLVANRYLSNKSFP